MHIQESTLRHLRWPSSLSREENVSHAFVNQILHSYALQEENILLHTFPNSIGICRQQTKFAAFILSLQNGKRAACSTLVPYCALFLFIRKHSISPCKAGVFTRSQKSIQNSYGQQGPACRGYFQPQFSPLKSVFITKTPEAHDVYMCFRRFLR